MNSDEKQCPYCGEAIKQVAVLCKHCKSSLAKTTPKELLSTAPVRWFYSYGYNSTSKFGPFTTEEIKEKIANGEISSSAQINKEGSKDSLTYEFIPELGGDTVSAALVEDVAILKFYSFIYLLYGGISVAIFMIIYISFHS